MVGRHRSPGRHVLIGALFAALAIAILAAAAEAHAVLLETTPAAGAVVASAPDAIVLRFNEPVRPISVRVLRAADEAALPLPPAQAIDTRLSVALPDGLPEGSYVPSYRVTSADGHPVAGSFVFSVGAAQDATIGSAADPYDVAWQWLGVAAHSLWYGSLLLAAGLALFLALIRAPPDLAPRLGRCLVGLALAGIASGPLLLAAEGGALLGGPPGSLMHAEVWQLAFGSSVLWTVATGGAGLAVLTLARRRRSPLLAGALLVALSFGLSGHAATAGPRWLTVPALGLHVLSAAFWVGALWPLLLALRGAEAKAQLEAFSRLAIAAVVCLILAGSVLAVLQLGHVSALIEDAYGRRLLAKLSLVAGLLGLAAVNRLVLTPALGRGGGARRRLRLTIGTELALAAGVIVLTASLGAVPPPRALALQTAAQGGGRGPPDYATYATARGFHLILVATPATAGANRIDLYVTGAAGRPAKPRPRRCPQACPSATSRPSMSRRCRSSPDTGAPVSACRSPAAGSCTPIS